jgi:hypothetical protein
MTMKKLILPLLLALTLSACATSGTTPAVTAGKSLLAMQETIVTVAKTGGALCNQAVLTKENCADLEQLYLRSQPAYDLAADSLIMALAVNSPESWQRYQERQTSFRSIFDDLLRLSAQFGKGGTK